MVWLLLLILQKRREKSKRNSMKPHHYIYQKLEWERDILFAYA